MLKLLTEEEKVKVMREYVLRRAVVIVSALILVVIVGMVGLFPSYILSSAHQNELKERVKVMEELKLVPTEESPQVWLNELNLKLKLLSPSVDLDRPTEFVVMVLEQRMPGIRITGFKWSKKDVQLSVSGIASDRQSLLTFENRLNASGKFSEVVLPVSNLAKDRDIAFQVKLSPKKNSNVQ